MLDRFRDLVLHPNLPRPTATEATHENYGEARAFNHHTHLSGYGG